MRIARFFVGAAISAAFSITLLAQQPLGYHTVACFKIKPDKSAEFHKFLTDESHKLAQGRVDDGEITGWILVRSVVPQGESAECDYLSISFFPKTPHLLDPDRIAAAQKKAGMPGSPQDYLTHRNAVSKLVWVSIFRQQAAVGSPKKGDYLRVNYMKVSDANFDDWIAYEKKVWQPVADALIKDGKGTAWSLNVREMPAGSDAPFQAVTVDSFSSMDGVFEPDPQFFDRFRKVHPDMDARAAFAGFEKLRTIGMVELYTIEDAVGK